MLDKVIEWLTSVINDFLPFFIVKEYEEALHLSGGKFKRKLSAGFYWKWSFYDEVLRQHIALTTINLPAQSLVTKDHKNIVVKAVVKYKITDIKTFLLEVYDSVDAISDVSQGIIKNVIMPSTWEECKSMETDNNITKKVRNELKKLGVHIETVTLTSIAEMRTIRLINQNETILND